MKKQKCELFIRFFISLLVFDWERLMWRASGVNVRFHAYCVFMCANHWIFFHILAVQPSVVAQKSVWLEYGLFVVSLSLHVSVIPINSCASERKTAKCEARRNYLCRVLMHPIYMCFCKQIRNAIQSDIECLLVYILKWGILLYYHHERMLWRALKNCWNAQLRHCSGDPTNLEAHSRHSSDEKLLNELADVVST